MVWVEGRGVERAGNDRIKEGSTTSIAYTEHCTSIKPGKRDTIYHLKGGNVVECADCATNPFVSHYPCT